jgi:prepilin-type N-terminal cleavage/methylation domain-containing protein
VTISERIGPIYNMRFGRHDKGSRDQVGPRVSKLAGLLVFPSPHPGRRSGFTLPELALVVCVFGLLVVMGIQQLQGLRSASRRNPLQCQENLRMIGFGLFQFAEDHESKFPWKEAAARGGSLEFVPTFQAAPHFQTLTNYIRNTRVLTCPLDTLRKRTLKLEGIQDIGISYFLNLSADPTDRSAVISGDRTLSTNEDTTTGLLEVDSSTPLQWTQPDPDQPGHFQNDSRNSTGNVLLGSQSLIETTTAQLRQLTRGLTQRPHMLVLP